MSESGIIPVGSEEQPLTPAQVINQVRLIQEIMKGVMQKDVHYGVIPGCGNKPSLLKPGAEKLCLTFGLVPEFAIQQTDLPGGHREYRVTCRLFTRRDHRFAGEGVGICTTHEKKYRYRWDNTGRAVPKEYWENRNRDLIGGESYEARKVDKGWMIFLKTEHTDPADYYNTAIKIGKKRAHVDATITATAAGDIFTQDIEDLNEAEVVPTVVPDLAPRPTAPAPATVHKPGPAERAFLADEDPGEPIPPPPQEPKPLPPTPPEAMKPRRAKGGDDGPPPEVAPLNIPADWPEWKLAPISEPQRKRMFALSKQAGLDTPALKAKVASFGYAKSEEILRGHYDPICESILPGSNKPKSEGQA
jgi:hypothetical protein